jgi:uncharacterized protein YcbX
VPSDPDPAAEPVLRVAGLFIYPLKGARGLALPAAELDELGFRHDRRWLAVDQAGAFLSQRTMPRLALLRPMLQRDSLRLEAPGMAPLALPLEDGTGDALSVRVWDDDVAALSAGAEAAQWISDYLEFPSRLVRLAPTARRPLDARYAPRPGGRVAFVDAYPCLLISQASLEGLNRRLATPLPMDRFRPNLVVDGTAAHAEDGWRRIRAGSVTFDVVKPCSRCVVTTVDQATGRAGEEPLRTLAGYRKVGSKVMFGQNLVHDGPGALACGDRVEVLA